MIRFSSTSVPFAFRSFDLRPGEALTDVQLATLLRWHPAKQEIALVCSDRPTLLAATAAFRAALVVAPKPAPETGAPVRPLAQQLADTVAALTAENAALKQQLAEVQQALAVATAPKPRRARKAKAQPVTPEAEAPLPAEAPEEGAEAQLGDLEPPF